MLSGFYERNVHSREEPSKCLRPHSHAMCSAEASEFPVSLHRPEAASKLAKASQALRRLGLRIFLRPLGSRGKGILHRPRQRSYIIAEYSRGFQL